MRADIFISYRGADRVLARRLETRLRSRWGSRVFRDETNLNAGRPWASELHAALNKARVVVALIGPGWRVDADAGSEDWVRKELDAALDGAKPVLAVLAGNVDELKGKLGSMPRAFQNQAVVVGPDLAGFDLREISNALNRLGAFGTQNAWSLSSRANDMVPDIALQQAHAALDEGKSLLVVGSSGSGRYALLKRLAQDLIADGHLVASHAIDPTEEPRQTHAVIAGWVRSLNRLFLDVHSDFNSIGAGKMLVEAILSAGSDLLSRRVVSATTLLELAHPDHDKRILDAVTRSTQRWAPFPPTRLTYQSRGVIELLLQALERGTAADPPMKRPAFFVDHFDSVDSVSKQLVMDFFDRPLKYCRSTKSASSELGGDCSDHCDALGMVIAVYDCGPNACSEVKKLAAMAARPDSAVARIDIDDAASWGSDWALKPWLDAHDVELEDAVVASLQEESNPYRQLAKLWYLVDYGIVTERRDDEAQDRATEEPDSEGRRAHAPLRSGMVDYGPVLQSGDEEEQRKVTWKPASKDGSVSRPTQDDILEHMVAEHVPLEFDHIVRAGALLGRTFSFYTAYFAAHPPFAAVADARPEEALSEREIERWKKKAEATWKRIRKIDPEGAVLRCFERESGETTISLAQQDLVMHLCNGMDDEIARTYHERLARYLVEPLDKNAGEQFGDRYRRAELAAEHWRLASRPREAADAHRHAAEIAERSLSYQEAQFHYENAKRLYVQLVADRNERERRHEDLLMLANCLYRHGQITRLANIPNRAEEGKPKGAIDHLEHALERLGELKQELLGDDARQRSQGAMGQFARDIPAPGLVGHHLRLYQGLSGHVYLELAQCHQAAVDACRARASDELHECEQCIPRLEQVRNSLFDALRHAEAARGEAGGGWLLASASARLADHLADEAIRRRATNEERSHNLMVEAFFHIERVTGLRALTQEEGRELADPVAWAWRSAARLFRHYALEPRIAEWAYRKMDELSKRARETVEMTIDRWLGGFLLSICKDEKSELIPEARELLERHRDWATESGVVMSCVPANLRLYLLELVLDSTAEGREKRKAHLNRAQSQSVDLSALSQDDSERRDNRVVTPPLDDALQNSLMAGGEASGSGREYILFEALETVLADSTWEVRGEQVVKSFKRALGSCDEDEDEKILRVGWTRIAGIILRRCPQLHEWVVNELTAGLLDWESDDLSCLLDRARIYVAGAELPSLFSPCSDHWLPRLASIRLPIATALHAKVSAQVAQLLLKGHVQACEKEEQEPCSVLARDLEYAALIHDWYIHIDPARMLTLATEWNLDVSGVEWADPKLLHGRLAVEVLREVYGAEREIGEGRYRRISKMVEHDASGRNGVDSTLKKVFFIANAIADEGGEKLMAFVEAAEEKSGDLEKPEPYDELRKWLQENLDSGWVTRAIDPNGLDKVYEDVVDAKARQARDAGKAVVFATGRAAPLSSVD